MIYNEKKVLKYIGIIFNICHEKSEHVLIYSVM